MKLIRSLAVLSCAIGLQAAPQGVTSSGTAPPNAALLARALPDNTLACLSLSPTPAQFDALVDSPLAKLVADGLGLQGIDIRLGITDAMDTLGLRREEVRALVCGGMTLGLTDSRGERLPGWLFLVRAGDGINALMRAVDGARQRATAAGIPSQKTTVEGQTIWVLRHPWSPLCWTRRDQTLIVGSSMPAVSRAAARLDERTLTDSLALDPQYTAFAARAQASGAMLTAYVRPPAICRALLPLLATDHAPIIATVRRALDLDRIPGVALALTHDGNTYQETIEVEWPEPRNGLLAHLVGHTGRLPTNAGELVPSSVSSFSITSADLARSARSAAAFLESIAPGPFGEASTVVRGWCQQAGIDLEADFVATLGGQIAVLQWLDRTRETTDLAVVIELTDRAHLDRTLNKLLPTVSIPIRSEGLAGYRAHLVGLDAPDLQPGFALTQRHLVLASTRTALEHTLDRLAGRAPALSVTIPQDHVAFGLNNLTATLGLVMEELRRSRTAVFAKLGRPAPTDGPNELALRALLAAGAVATTRVQNDARGLVLSTQSEIGPLALVGVALGLPRAQQGQQTAARQLDAHAGVRLALQLIAAAEHTLRAAGDRVGFVPLRTLVDKGAIDAETLGTLRSENLYARDGFLLTVLLDPASPDDFTVVAWPADSRTGPVFVADAKGNEATNEIIARALGVSLVELGDVYSNGFGSPMRSGWRQQAAVAIAPPAEDGSRVQATFDAIAALERTPPTSKVLPALLVDALRSDQPALVARACHALGMLHRTAEVPTLVQLAIEHADKEVRIQALWALSRLRDARAQPAALAGLQSDDVTLRTLAATILGTLRVRAAAPALLKVAAEPASEADERDRIAALAALSDLGDPGQLLAMAAAVTTGSTMVEQSLTYAFQTLSPKLALEAEATTLVAVLGHSHRTLRTYAIQRLAELRVPATARALEGRLGREERGLLPLLQVAIDQVRNDRTGVQHSLTERAEAMLGVLTQAWNGLPVNQRYAAGCGAIILLLILGIALSMRGRARSRAAGETWAALAAPSEPEYDELEYESEPAYLDHVDLHIGASGVFRADEYETDALLPSSSVGAPRDSRQ